MQSVTKLADAVRTASLHLCKFQVENDLSSQEEINEGVCEILSEITDVFYGLEGLIYDLTMAKKRALLIKKKKESLLKKTQQTDDSLVAEIISKSFDGQPTKSGKELIAESKEAVKRRERNFPKEITKATPIRVFGKDFDKDHGPSSTSKGDFKKIPINDQYCPSIDSSFIDKALPTPNVYISDRDSD